MSPRSLDPRAARHAAQPLFDRFRAALDLWDLASRWLIVASLGTMTVLVSLQVFFRYVLGSSIDWADECSRLLFVWSMFLAIPHGVRTGVHVGIDLLVKRFPPIVRTALFRCCAALSMALFGLVFAQSLRAAHAALGEMMPTLEITAAVFYLPVTLAMAHGALHCLPLVLYGEAMVEAPPDEADISP